MENKIYYTLPDGSVIDDDYIADTVQHFDDALQSKKARLCPNPHQHVDMLHTEFKNLPAELQKELKPLMRSV